MSNNSGGSGCLIPIFILLIMIGGAVTFIGISPPTADGGTATTFPAVEVVLAPAENGVTWDDLQTAYSVMNRRLLALSTNGQIESYTMDSSRLDMTIVIRFSEGTASTQDVLDVLLESGYIEFVDLSAVDPSNLSAYEGQSIATTASVERSGDDSGQLVFPTILTHEDISQATAIGGGAADGLGGYRIQIDLTQMGAERMGAFSEANIGSGLAVVLDGVVLSVPTIQGRIETPISLTGTFTEAEAVVLAAQINSRPLPIAMSVQSVTYILPPE